MQDRSESWLDTRLGSDDAWRPLADGEPEVSVDVAAVASVLADAAGVVSDGGTAGALTVAVEDDGSWLAGVALDEAATVLEQDQIMIDETDLLETDLFDTDSMGGFVGDVIGDLDPTWASGGEPEAGSAIVDPFDVFLAETAADATEVADLHSGDGLPDEAVSADADPVGDSLAALAEATEADGTPVAEAEAEQPVSTAEGAGAALDTAIETAADTGTSVMPVPSRLDAFDDFDAGSTAPDAADDDAFDAEAGGHTDDTFGDDLG